MLSFHEYWKTNSKNLPNKVSAKRAYKKYVECEEEVMSCSQQITTLDFKKAKDALVKASVPQPNVCISAFTAPNVNWFSFDDVCQKQEGTTPMNTNSDRCSQSNSERDYLNRRLDNVWYTLGGALRAQFHIDEVTQPRTYKELIDWIENGKYELNSKETKRIDAQVQDDTYFGFFTDGIVWTGRGFKQDFDGFREAGKALDKAKQAAKDIVNTSDAAAGLKALQEFEAWTFPVPAEAIPVAGKGKHSKSV